MFLLQTLKKPWSFSIIGAEVKASKVNTFCEQLRESFSTVGKMLRQGNSFSSILVGAKCKFFSSQCVSVKSKFIVFSLVIS